MRKRDFSLSAFNKYKSTLSKNISELAQYLTDQ